MGKENPGLTGFESVESLAIESEIAFPIASKNPVRVWGWWVGGRTRGRAVENDAACDGTR